MLNDQDLERYSRQVIFEQIGEGGQEKLCNSKVVLCGLGGLGCPAATYLVLAGLGEIVLIDHDHVESSNLPRQTLFEEADIGRPKVMAAAERLGYYNPACRILPVMKRMNSDVVEEYATGSCLWIDATDHYQAREDIAALALSHQSLLISASVQGMQGHITTFAADPKEGTFKDVYPHKPNQTRISQCEQVGIVGSVAGVLGSMLATEAIKEILHIGQGLKGKMLLYDGLFARVRIWDILRSR